MNWTDLVAAELRKCTDCGLCLAACPTFAISRAEGDSPRGRINLIASQLASGSSAPAAAAFLSGCIECSACHSPCPTGVRFARARRAHRVATDGLDRLAFERRVKDLAHMIAQDPGAGLTIGAIQSLLTDTAPGPAWHGPRDHAVLLLPGRMFTLAAPKVVERLRAAVAEHIPGLVRDPRLSSALDRASGLLRDVGLSAEHDRAVDDAVNVIAARPYERLTVAVLDLLGLRLAEEALPSQVRVVPAFTVLAGTSLRPFQLESSGWVGGGGDLLDGTDLGAKSGQVPVELWAASAPVLLAANALTAVRDLVDAKRAWLRGRPLVTSDSRDLVRFPGSRHVIDLMVFGGQQ